MVRALFKQLRRSTQLFSVVILAVGVVFLSGYYLFSPAKSQPPAAQVLYVLASIFISSGLITLFLSRVSIEESREHTRHVITEVIDDKLTEVLSTTRLMLDKGAQRDYRWHSVLRMPDEADAFPEFAIQEVDISKELHILRSEIRFVCISSSDDGALSGYPEDKGYVLRWMVDEALDPEDAKVFSLLSVKLSGKDQKIEKRRFNVTPTAPFRAVEYYCRLPREIVDNNPIQTISWRYRTRQYVGNDQRIDLDTQIFATTYGAEFRCTVGESLPLRSFGYDKSQVTGLGGPPTVTATEPMKDPKGPCTLLLRFEDVPLLSGSAVTFRIVRA